MGKNVRAARRLAAILMAGTLAGTMTVGSVPTITITAASWRENADYIFEYLTQRLGYSEAAACGIMANIYCESTFNSHAWNAGGGSYGLCQWGGGRYGRLQSWCGSNGYDYTTIDGQLAYLEYELTNYFSYVEDFLRSVENTSDGAYNAAQYYCYHFEAPASRGSVSHYRGSLASGTYWESYRPAEWYQVDGIWRYVLRDGTYQTGWLTLDDETFYFDEEGRRICGWKTIDGKRYYFDEDGVMINGWYKVDGCSYYFAEDGSLVTALAREGEELYLLDDYGEIQASSDMKEYAQEWIAEAEEREKALVGADQDSSSADTGHTAAPSDEDAETTLAAANTQETQSEGPRVIGRVDYPADPDVSTDSEPAAATEGTADTEPAAATEGTADTEPAAATEGTADTEPAAATEGTADTEPAAATEGTADTEPAAAAEAPADTEPAAAAEAPADTEPVAAADDLAESGKDVEEERLSSVLGLGQPVADAGDGQNKSGFGINSSEESKDAQTDAVPQTSEDEEEYASAAAAMQNAAAEMDEEAEEEGEAPVFVLNDEDDTKESAAAAVSGVDETTEGSGADNDSEERTDDEGAKKAVPLAPLVEQPVEEAETETPAQTLTRNIPFSFGDFIRKITGRWSGQKEDAFEPVYNTPFAFADASKASGANEASEAGEVKEEGKNEDSGVVLMGSAATGMSGQAAGDNSDSEQDDKNEDAEKAETAETANSANNKSEQSEEERLNKDQTEEPEEESGSKDEDKTEDEKSEESGEETEVKDEDKTEDEKSEEPEAESESKDEDKTEDEKSEESGEESETKDEDEIRDDGGVRITLSKDIPDISSDDLDNLVDILRRKNILHAVTRNGLNITPQVEASFEKDEDSDDKYTVTFRVQYNGSEAELESSVHVTD